MNDVILDSAIAPPVPTQILFGQFTRDVAERNKERSNGLPQEVWAKSNKKMFQIWPRKDIRPNPTKRSPSLLHKKTKGSFIPLRATCDDDLAWAWSSLRGRLASRQSHVWKRAWHVGVQHRARAKRMRDALIGPITRARAKRFKEALIGLIQDCWTKSNQEELIEPNSTLEVQVAANYFVHLFKVT